MSQLDSKCLPQPEVVEDEPVQSHTLPKVFRRIGRATIRLVAFRLLQPVLARSQSLVGDLFERRLGNTLMRGIRDWLHLLFRAVLALGGSHDLVSLAWWRRRWRRRVPSHGSLHRLCVVNAILGEIDVHIAIHCSSPRNLRKLDLHFFGFFFVETEISVAVKVLVVLVVFFVRLGVNHADDVHGSTEECGVSPTHLLGVFDFVIINALLANFLVAGCATKPPWPQQFFAHNVSQ